MGSLLTGFALFLEREAGHVVLSCGVIWLGMMLADPATRAQAARDLVLFGLGVLSRSMGGASRNIEPREVTNGPVRKTETP